MNRNRDLERARAEAAELCEQAATLAERVRRLALTLAEEAEDEAGGESRPKLRLIRGGLAAVLGLILAWRWLRRAMPAHPAAAAAAVTASAAAVVLTIPSVGAGPPHRAPGLVKTHQRTTPARASHHRHGSASPRPGTSQPGPAPAPSQRTSPLPLPTSSLPVPLPSPTLPKPKPSKSCPGIVVLGKCLPL